MRAEGVLLGIDINPYSPGVSAQTFGVLDRPEVVATGEQAHSCLPDLLDLFSQSYVRKFGETFRDRASQSQALSGRGLRAIVGLEG